MALTKSELVQMLIKQIGLNGREAFEMIEKLHGEITASPEPGKGLELVGDDGSGRHAMGRQGAPEQARGDEPPDGACEAASAPSRLIAGGGRGKEPRG